MSKNVTQKLIETHLMSGRVQPGEEIALKIDQTLTQDATGTLAMLEFEAMALPRVKTELSAQYIDHNPWPSYSLVGLASKAVQIDSFVRRQ